MKYKDVREVHGMILTCSTETQANVLMVTIPKCKGK